MNKSHLLVVDDDQEITALVSTFLANYGYQISIAANANEMFQLLNIHSNIALIILDLMLPDISGLDICQQLRHSFCSIPIIMLTAARETVEKIIGLEMGADDYLTKPFHPRELVARIKTILRRCDNNLLADKSQASTFRHYTSWCFEFASWKLYTATRQLFSVEQVEISLTSKNYDLLLIFLQNSQRVLSRDYLMDRLNNRESYAFDRSIDVQVSRLRHLLGDDQKNFKIIKTIRAGGYIFAVPVKRHQL